jgi:hypothetical protein
MHFLVGEVMKPVIYKIIQKKVNVLILVHSDDGNISLSSQEILTDREKLMLLTVGNSVSLMFSLAYSGTKLSISCKPSHMSYGLEGKNSDIHSELVSIYNKSGKITDSWVRQSSEVVSSCTFKSFPQNYLALLTRCVTIHSLSNQMIWPEILFRNYTDYLKGYFLEKSDDVYDKTLQWGGDKAVSLRNISKFGFWGDNLIKFVNQPSFISHQIKNPVSENSKKVDTKNLKKFEFEYRIQMLRGLFKDRQQNDLAIMVEEEYKRVATIKSGVFLSDRDGDFFNFYKHRNSECLTFFEQRRNYNKELDKLAREKLLGIEVTVEPKIKRYRSTEVRKLTENEVVLSNECFLDEFIVGSEEIFDELKDDIKKHGKAFLRSKLQLGGSLWKNQYKTKFAITGDFTEALTLINNPKKLSDECFNKT